MGEGEKIWGWRGSVEGTGGELLGLRRPGGPADGRAMSGARLNRRQRQEEIVHQEGESVKKQ